MRLRASNLSLYDGNVDNSLRWDRHANCDDPEQDIISYDYLFTAFLNYYMRWRSHNVLFSFIPYQYVICTSLFLWKLSMFSTTSALLASRRAPDASFSSPRQGSSWKSDLILFPVIILERTGSTEQMDVTPVSSERQQMYKYSGKYSCVFLGPFSILCLSEVLKQTLTSILLCS